MKLELTEDEAQALVGLMDLGVKSGGLQVAAAAAVLLQKIQAARKPKPNGISQHAAEAIPPGAASPLQG
jgi:predicted DNA-binding transcriptional regulator YafY